MLILYRMDICNLQIVGVLYSVASWIGQILIVDGVAKSPFYCVTAFFQDLDILEVCLHP